LLEETRTRLGPVGVWLPTATMPVVPEAERAAVARLAELGYGSMWSGEGPGTREVFAYLGDLLASTSDIVLGSGIANVWARPGHTAHSGGATLARAHPGRFVLGVGIGHAFQAAKYGADYRPIARMRDYLAEMDAAAAENPPPVPFPRVLAAVGPKMLELSREHADGAHPFAQPLEHTPYAREILGPDKLLIPHQTVLLGTRQDARAHVRRTQEMLRQHEIPHYTNSWKRLGYTNSDLGDASDRFVDGLIAWGDEEKIARRVTDLLEAGADHVLITPAATSLESTVDALARLAPALAEVRR
jgi:probable F420-dependent oxidoreductase